MPNRSISRLRQWGSILIVCCLALLAILCVVNSLFSHLTPDISVYLIQANTFVQELDRFTLSHDSKGIMIMFILALPVLIFGPTMLAAAIVQFCAHAVAFAAGYFVLRRYTDALPALIVSLLGLCAIHSYRVWGGNARPEDFALAFVFVSLWAALRGDRTRLAIAGAMAACCFFLKVSLTVTPALIVAASILYNAVSRAGAVYNKKISRALSSIAKDGSWALIGFAAVTVFALGWILLFDDVRGWYDQSIQWPLKYRMYSVPFTDMAKTTFRLFETNRLSPLLLGGCAGLLFAWFRGFRKESILLAVAILAELFRMTTEIARWYYLLAIVIPLLMIAAGFLAITGNRKTNSAFVWIIPLIFLLPYISDLPQIELQAFELQCVKRCPSPSQYFVDEFQSVYNKGETIFVASNDLQMYPLLDAPRPAPVLPIHFSVVSPEKQQAALLYYEQFPPTWVIKRSSPSDRPLPNIIGGVNYAYHVQCPADTPQVVEFPEIEEESGSSLFVMLSKSSMYRIEIESGLFQAWRLVEPDTPEGEQ